MLVALSPEISRTLDRICASREFRASKRSQEFLRFIVGEMLAGRQAELKERLIAIRLYHRDPSYSAAEDSIVRVQARDVRNRLARYYESEEGRSDSHRIELPIGSYLVVYSPVPEPQPPYLEPEKRLETPPPESGRLWIWLAAGLAVAIGLTWIFWQPRRTAWQQVWRPVQDSSHPILIATGRGRHFSISPRLEQQLEQRPALATLEPGDVQKLKTDMVSFENAIAISNLFATVQRMDRIGELRLFNQITSMELRRNPVILVGAFNNGQTMNLMSRLRYRFENVDRRPSIVDSTDRGRVWSFAPPSSDTTFSTNDDYAMVTRLLEPGAAPQYIVAGIFGTGTMVAADFLTQARYWDSVVKSAPDGWQMMNFQVILKTTVVENAARPPEVVTTHFWR